MKRFESFLRDSNKVGKAAAISTIVILFVLWNVSGVLWGFWRTLDNLTSNGISNPEQLQYGYWYGNLWWGYGYWYGFWSWSVDAGYYYDAIETWSNAYDNPRVVTPNELQYMSNISGTIWSASSVTITAVAQMQIATWVTVTLPAWLIITDTAGWTFNFSNLTWSTNSSVTDLTNKTWTPIDFWVTWEWLNFSKPVKVEINVWTNNPVYPRVKHFGGTWWVDGLTLDVNATCSNWVATPTISLTQTVTPASNIITIYTCRASTFAASTPTDDSNDDSSSSWGGWGGWWSIATICTDSQLECKTVAWVSRYYRKALVNCTWWNLWKVCGLTTDTTEWDKTNVEETTDWKTIIKINGKDIVISDVSWSFAKLYIEKLYSLWITNWYSDGTFRPENKTTRAEYLKIVLKAMWEDYSSEDTSDLKFEDVEKNTWVAKAVKKAAALWIITTENTKFRPNDTISRAEAMKMLLKAFGIETPEVAKSSFSDVTGWAVKYVEKAKIMWIIAANTTFRPTESITRAEVSKVVVKTMELK